MYPTNIKRISNVYLHIRCNYMLEQSTFRLTKEQWLSNTITTWHLHEINTYYRFIDIIKKGLIVVVMIIGNIGNSI